MPKTNGPLVPVQVDQISPAVHEVIICTVWVISEIRTYVLYVLRTTFTCFKDLRQRIEVIDDRIMNS